MGNYVTKIIASNWKSALVSIGKEFNYLVFATNTSWCKRLYDNCINFK